LDAPFDCLAGIPVFVGGMDAWCASVGMGCTFDGCAINISGTSEVFGLVVSEFLESEGLITVPWGEGLYHIGGPSQVGADCLRWFLETFCAGSQGIDPYDLLTDLKCCRRRSRPIIFLPYLRGERTPLWDPEARGLFLGINRNHARTDFLWAVLEGVALANRQILDLATGGYPARADQVRIGGGAARSDLWCQVKADVLQLPVIRTAAAETGLLGSALLGWCGLGTYSSLAEGQSKMIRIERTFEPQSGPGGQRARAYDLIYERFLEIQAVALPLFRSLAKAERDGLALGV
jgi:xylulokinase